MKSLPDNWILASVRDLVILGPRNYVDDNTEAGFIPLNLLGTRYNDQPGFEKRRWRDIKRGFTHLADGDVLLARITPSFENGKAGVVSGLPNGVGAGSTEYFVCRPVKGGVEPGYLLAFFKTRQFKLEGKRQMSGAVGQQRVPKEYVADAKIPLPPLSEQKRIVRKLHVTFRTADKCIADAIKLEKRAEQFERSVLNAAISGTLTFDWRTRFPQLEDGGQLRSFATAGHRSLETDDMKIAGPDGRGTTEIKIDLPKSWCWLTGAEAVSPGADIVYGIVQPGPQRPDGVPYIRGMDIEDGIILAKQLARTSREIASRYSRSALAPGDVLLGIIRATKVAIVPAELAGANITQGTSRFRPSEFILSDYLAIVLRAPAIQHWLQDHFRGIDMPGLNLADVRRVPIPLPPIDEQSEIVAQVKKHQHVAASIRRFANAMAKRASYVEQAILDKAFSGELLDSESPRLKPIRLDQVRNRIDIKKLEEQAQRRSWRAKPVHKITIDSVRETIRSYPSGRFTASDLQDRLGLDYETFKGFLFQLLGESSPVLEQIFDAKSQGIHLQKVSQ